MKMLSPQKVLIISFTPVASEARVIRQAEMFLQKGWDVYVAGYPGKGTPDQRWHFIPLSRKKNKLSKFYGLMGILPSYTDFAYQQLFFLKTLIKYLESYPVHIIMCHDYYTAPLAAALSKLFSCPYCVDIHEHALTQDKPITGLGKKLVWFLRSRYIHNLQKKYFPQAHALTTVSDGIANSLQQDYALSSRPTVVRSVPFYQACTFRPLHPQDPIKLLYHGGFAPDRGLEECIQAMALCDERFSLTLRGNGDPAYEHMLRQLADQSPAKERIHFEPLVPFHEIIPKASLGDIGLFIPPEVSLQRTYTLPNKFFEYIMAGLVTAASDLPEMARIVKTYDLGILIPAAKPQEIARAFNTLTYEKINYYKQQALLAAKELCWEKEAEKLEKLFVS